MRTLLVLCLLLVKSLVAVAAGATPYYEIQTPFVVNLADKDDLRFLQVNAQLKVKNDEVKQKLHSHLPAIQHTVLMVLSEQTSQDVRSVPGKQKLRETTLKEIQQLMMDRIGNQAIDDIYFTAFIIQ